MRAWRTLVSATSRLMGTLDAELQRDCVLALADYEVLVHLSEEPGHRARMSELAEALDLSPSGLTRRVDRLARDDLVRRERCPSDRRGSFAVLTPSGYERLVAAAPSHLHHVRQHFVDRFTPRQLATLADAMSLVMEACPPRGGAVPGPVEPALAEP
ncbi:MAG: MarR family transcriptional regulator [Acidimicrobiia bacterium]|nr:MarR family transcriptional regulator [Acidimicrobiia bacterium]